MMILPVVLSVNQAPRRLVIIHSLERWRRGQAAGSILCRLPGAGGYRRRRHRLRAGACCHRRRGRSTAERGVGRGRGPGVVGRRGRRAGRVVEVVVCNVGVAAGELLHDGAELRGAGGEHHGARDVHHLDSLPTALPPSLPAAAVHRRLGDAAAAVVVLHAELLAVHVSLNCFFLGDVGAYDVRPPQQQTTMINQRKKQEGTQRTGGCQLIGVHQLEMR
jgi:hypothetical protein